MRWSCQWNWMGENFFTPQLPGFGAVFEIFHEIFPNGWKICSIHYHNRVHVFVLILINCHKWIFFQYHRRFMQSQSGMFVHRKIRQWPIIRRWSWFLGIARSNEWSALPGKSAGSWPKRLRSNCQNSRLCRQNALKMVRTLVPVSDPTVRFANSAQTSRPVHKLSG